MAQQMFGVKIKNWKEIVRMVHNLPIRLQKEIMSESSTFLQDVRKSAKLRAPRYSGFLASSIFVDKVGDKQVVLSVDAHYAYEQETGEGLPRLVPTSQLKKSGWTHEASRTRGGLKKTGSIQSKPGFFVKRSYKPFLGPALEKNLNKLAQRMSKATNKAIKRSKGGK